MLWTKVKEREIVHLILYFNLIIADVVKIVKNKFGYQSVEKDKKQIKICNKNHKKHTFHTIGVSVNI